MNRTLLTVLLLAGVWAGVVTSRAYSQTFPSKPVRIIVGYPAGGESDIIVRRFGQVFQGTIGQPVIVDNRPSAAGILGSVLNAQAAPDGHTITYVASPTQTINPHLQKNLGFNPLADYTPITILVRTPLVLLSNRSLPVGNVAELLAFARANPGKLTFGSGGMGSGNHLAGELFKKHANIDVLHVPYKGGGQATVMDVINGTLSFMFGVVPNSIPFIRNGQLNPLAVSSRTRSAALPNVPTVIETGIPNFDVSIWFGFEGPPKLPKPIVDVLSAAIRRAASDPVFSRPLLEAGYDVAPSSPEEMEAKIKSDYDLWGPLVKEAKIE